MRIVPITALFSTICFVSLNAEAENVYQPSVFPFSSVTPNQLWRHTGSGVVKEVRSKDGIMVIETNLGSEASPHMTSIAYTVRGSDMLDTNLVNSTIIFSYYQEDKYDVITNIKNKYLAITQIALCFR